MRKIWLWLIAVLVFMFTSRAAQASFHLMKINEVMAQAGGDPRLQFIELQMTSTFQNLVGGQKLLFFDAKGNKTGEFTIPSNVTNSQMQSGELPFILFGTQAFKDRSAVAPDFVIPEGLLPPFSGKVAFETIDSIAYGDFTGANAGFGSPAPGFPVNGALSLTRLSAGSPRNNATDYAFRTPSPRNNAFASGVFNAGLPCHFTDSFADMSHWDQPARNAGLDLNNCGAQFVADIGFVEVNAGKLVFTPGRSDQLDLGNPIAFTTLNNETAQSVIGQDPSQNYRVQFNMLAHTGIEDSAFFVRQHIDFDSASKTLDPFPAAGFGFNLGFDNIGETTDHIHADVRLVCISEGSVDGEDEVDFPPGFIVSTEKLYTIVMDVDGDDETGPLTLQIKMYPADQPETLNYLATFKMGQGLGASPREDLDHGLLMAALGKSGTMEVSDLSICAIPRNQQHVRCLSCERQIDGSILATWQNPSLAENKPIDVLVNGAKVESLPGDAIDTTLADPPAGDVTITLVNYSTTPQSCTICENDPPVAKIAGPATVAIAPNLSVTLDSSDSTDPDGGELLYVWEVVDSPAGSNPAIDDFTAAVISVSLDLEGAYTIKLTLSDKGCNGDPNPLSSTAEHTVTVFKPGGGNKFIRGDSNCSGGEPDISDAIHMLTFSFLGGNPPCCSEAADVNGEGDFAEVADAVTLLERLFLGGRQIPPPYPACGEVEGISCEAHPCNA